MFIAKGNIENLLQWFRDGPLSRYLLLFVGGHVRDSDFFTALFEKKETIDLVSGMEVAVFLFANSIETALELHPQEGNIRFVPGSRIDKPPLNRYSRAPQIQTVHISEVNSSIKNEVVQSSLTFGHHVAEHFDLGPSDTPALILLSKWHAEPLVIRTRGQADVETVLSFLRDIRSIRLPFAEKPRKQKKEAKERLRAAIAHLEQSGRRLDLAIESWKERLFTLGMPRPVLDELLARETGSEVWQRNGANGANCLPAIAKEYETILHQALESDEFKSVCQLVQRKAKLHGSHMETVRKAQNRVTHYEKLVVDAEGKLKELEVIRQDVDKLARQYQRKLHWKNTLDTISSFLNSILGLSKKAKEIGEAKDEIMKLLGK
jgi:hypothetical protein